MILRPAAAVLVLGFALSSIDAQTSRQVALEVAAVASTQPLQLAFSWPADATATAYSVSRRAAGAAIWGPQTSVPGGGGATAWTDTTVALGERYEYRFIKAGSPVARGFVTAGVEAAPIHDRGYCVLLVDATVAAALAPRIDRLVLDLVGDGWEVARHDVAPTAAVPAVKALIAAEAAARPGASGTVFLLGRIPVPYSGRINPDGHSNHIGAWAADAYYGELDGVWTDATVNVTSASRTANHNFPGDGKFDQSALPSDVDLAVGRVDLSNMPAFAATEQVLLERYLDKDHDYRHKVFAADPRAVIDDNFGYFGGEAFAASGWRAFSALLGAANVSAGDYFGSLNTTSGGGYVWSYGCGGGSYTSAGGIGNTNDFAASTNRSVFTMLFGSYFGDWDATDNFLRAPLCSGWTLTSAWAGRPHWSFHPMGLGETIGFCARQSQNDTSAGGYGARWVHIALMGDPTLRQHVLAPPQQPVVVDQWPMAALSWTASAEPVAGYHVYRSADPLGPFTRLTAQPVTNLAFVDPSAMTGPSTYMVRAVRLETTPTGSYWNLSQGVFANTCLPARPASHTEYGIGCYTISDSCYQVLADPAAAAAVLNGRSLQFTPAAGGYAVAPGGSAFVPPTAGAVPLNLGDDDQVAVPLAQPMPIAGGPPTAVLHVHSNGIVGAAPLAMSAPASALPDPAGLLGEAAPAFYAWHDFDPTEPGSGHVVVEQIGGTVYVTWDGVESRPAVLANPSTLQMQFDLGSGVVRVAWNAVAATGTGATLVGWSPGGPSVDGGAQDLFLGPIVVGPNNLRPLHLAATPAPVSTAATGTLVTYTLDEVPAFSPGYHAGLVVFGSTPAYAGIDLAASGLPGCNQWLGSIDWVEFVSGSTSTLASSLNVPPGIPCGSELFVQGLAVVPPRSLPGGLNPLGAVVSNGVATFVNGY